MPGEGIGWLVDVLPVSIYLLFSAAMAVSAAFHSGTGAALSLFGASLLSVVGTAGTKYGLLWGTDRVMRIGTPIVGLVLLALAFWLTGYFSVTLFGLQLSGLAWAAIGVVVALVFMRQEDSE